MKINKSILREADIRGVYPDNVNVELARKLGNVYGSYLRSIKEKYCVVGHDNRFGGPELTGALIKGLREAGVNVVYVGLVTTPMLNFACHKMEVEYGIEITASHNPVNENGFKLFGKNYLHMSHEELKIIYDGLLDEEFEFKSGRGSLEEIDIYESYARYITKNIKPGNRHLRVVVDPGNGTGSVIVKRIYKKLPFKAEFINTESDPTFPNHHPDPSDSYNLKQLQKAVLNSSADLGIAYDGDADRVGLVDNHGKVVDADKMISLMALELLKTNNEQPILFDIKCSNMVKDIVEKNGGTTVEVSASSARQEQTMFESDCIFGGGYSNHIFFRDNHPGYDDGIYAGLRFHDMLSHTNKSLHDMVKKLPKYCNSEEIRKYTPESKKKALIKSIKVYCENKKYEICDVEGIKAYKKNGSWALVRPSNTGPYITIRFEAKNKKDLAKIQKEFLAILDIEI